MDLEFDEGAWNPDPYEVGDGDLPLEVGYPDDFSFREDEAVPVFATVSLETRVGYAQLSWEDELTALLSADIDEDRRAQRLVPVVIGRQIVALAFERRTRRQVRG